MIEALDCCRLCTTDKFGIDVSEGKTFIAPVVVPILQNERGDGGRVTDVME